MRYLKPLAALVLTLAAVPTTGLAQRERLDFSINSPYRLRMENHVLPAGTYRLYQISDNNLNLFFLYLGDRTQPPVAVISTVPRGSAAHWPDKAAIHWRVSERDPRSLPLITGWDIPGYTGWQIIGVVTTNDGDRRLGRLR